MSKFEDKDYVYKKVNEVIERNKEQDLFHKAFLRPVEIALKTRLTENDKRRRPDALPFGLKQVLKKDISLNQYTLKDFKAFRNLPPNDRKMDVVVENNLDNLISLMKPTRP